MAHPSVISRIVRGLPLDEPVILLLESGGHVHGSIATCIQEDSEGEDSVTVYLELPDGGHEFTTVALGAVIGVTRHSKKPLEDGEPAEQDGPRQFFTAIELDALKKGVWFDVESASSGEWPWYIAAEKGEDGLRDDRAVKGEDGEWRIYFATAIEAVNTLGL